MLALIWINLEKNINITVTENLVDLSPIPFWNTKKSSSWWQVAIRLESHFISPHTASDKLGKFSSSSSCRTLSGTIPTDSYFRWMEKGELYADLLSAWIHISVTIMVWTPALCLLDTSDKSFLYAYHIRHSPYAWFVWTTSFPYRYHPLSVILVLLMIPSLLRIR